MNILTYTWLVFLMGWVPVMICFGSLGFNMSYKVNPIKCRPPSKSLADMSTLKSEMYHLLNCQNIIKI